MVQTNDHKTIVVNYDKSGNYYFIMPDCDVSINAEYLPIQYTITYDLNGGENNANNPTTYTVDSNDIIISQPTYTNYYFSGWTINDGSQIVRDYTIPSGTTGNITLKANFKKDEYTIVATRVDKFSVDYRLIVYKNGIQIPFTEIRNSKGSILCTYTNSAVNIGDIKDATSLKVIIDGNSYDAPLTIKESY